MTTNQLLTLRATQWGNPRQETFFGEEDYQHYVELMSQFCRAEQAAIWAYCLMPNHVYLIVEPPLDFFEMGESRTGVRPSRFRAVEQSVASRSQPAASYGDHGLAAAALTGLAARTFEPRVR